jgi:putative hydrolase of the HAD superfamily
MNHAKELFFDLDHTLWDFEKNADETLAELYEIYKLNQYSDHTPEEFAAIYHRINDELWELYNEHKIEKAFLRTNRFVQTFKEMGYPEGQIPNNLWEQYLEICPTKLNLIPDAKEVLSFLSSNYKLHLITNGFKETQHRKLKHTGLDQFFDTLTISEELGIQKPDPRIFETALKNAGSNRKTGVYVGDNFNADVLGGIRSGWNVFWYLPKKEKDRPAFEHPQLVRIKKLKELLNHF